MARYWPKLLFGAFMIVLTTCLTLIQPYLLGTAIDDLQNNRPQSDVLTIALIMLGIAVVQNIIEFFARYEVNAVSRYVEYDLRNDLFAHLQTMQQSFFHNMH